MMDIQQATHWNDLRTYNTLLDEQREKGLEEQHKKGQENEIHGK